MAERSEIETGEMRTEDIGTEVFFMPAAAHTEKSGSFTNTQRVLQWRHQAVEPAGDARSELWFMYHLGRRIREKLATSTDEMDRPVLELTWEYPVEGPQAEPSAEAVLAEINGWDGQRKPLSSYTQLKDDGSTACGCWIYCGVRADGVNQAARRKPGAEQSWVAPEWGWAWPSNRRILYNRASADPDGKPWSDRKALVWWDDKAGQWTGRRAGLHRRPAALIPACRRCHRRRRPFRRRPVHPAGRRQRLAVRGRAWWTARCPRTTSREVPFVNPLYGQQRNPVREIIRHRQNPLQPAGSEPGAEVFPYVATTYRLTEHQTAGGMSRTLPYLSELQPEFFCEVSPELAAERDLSHLGWATIITARTRSRPGSWSPSGSGPSRCRAAACTRSGCRTTGGLTASAPATRRTT